MYIYHNVFRKDVNLCKKFAIFEERTLIYDTLIKTDVIWLGALILSNKVTFTEGNGQFIFSSKNAFILVLTEFSK